MNSILKYLTGSSKTKLQASPEILARVTANIARLEAEALAEAKAEFAIREKAELEKKQQEAKIKAEQEAKSKEAYTKEVDKKHSVINEQHKGNYGEVVLEDKKQSKIYPIAKQTEPTDLFSKVKEEEAKKAENLSKQKIESEKRLAAEIAETDKLNSSQFSNGIKVNSEIQFDADRKIYPISTKTTPQDTFSLFEGKSSQLTTAVDPISLLINKFDKDINKGGGEVSGVFTLKDASDKVVRVKKYGKVVENSEQYSEKFLLEASAHPLFPKNVMKSLEVLHTSNEEELQTTYRIMEKAEGISDFKGASKVHLAQLVKDITILNEMGLQVDPKKRNMLYDKKKGFQIFDIGLSTFQKNSEGTLLNFDTFWQTQDKNLNKHLASALRSAVAYTGNAYTTNDFIEALKEEQNLNKKVDLTRADRPKKVSKATQPITEQSVAPEEIKAKLEIDEAAKLTTAVVPQETAPSSIVEELKPQEPQVLEDKKVASLAPEPVKPENQEVPKEPNINEEEQKAKLLQAEEAKKLEEIEAKAERATQEVVKQRETEEKTKTQELPKSSNTPKVADAERVEPKIRVIPPKDIKPIQADSLVSFDTETTGIDTKKSRIWQVGSATNLGEGKDYHLNPFETSPRNSQSFFQSLKNANGIFSEKAAAAGNFAGAISDFKKRKLVNLNQGLLETVGKFENTSVAVLQNANFENRLIQAAVSRGEINKDTLNMLSSKFMHSSIDKQGKLTGALFNTSSKVKDAMREAEYTFRTKFMPSRSEESFKTYTDFLNTAYRQYGDDIISAKAAGKITSVELMDISKIFYANLAERNLISKNSVQLGLNIEFLASTLLGETEKHLASSDSSQTIRLFQRLNTHIGDMLSGNITDKLKEDAAKIRENQPAEVNKKFLSTLNSRLEDLQRRGYTYQTNSEFSFYSPESRQKNMATGEIENIDGITLNNEKMKLTTMEAVIQDTFRSYEHYSDNLEGFNRAAYSTKLQEDIGKGSKLGDILSTVQNTTPEVEGPTLPFNYETDFEAKGQGLQKAARDISGDTIFLGKQMKKSTAGAILAGTAATLGVMAMTDNPNKNEIDQNAPVFENFYDEQYLGTAFVEFRDRNKRYVY